jgi:hypothetical protein
MSDIALCWGSRDGAICLALLNAYVQGQGETSDSLPFSDTACFILTSAEAKRSNDQCRHLPCPPCASLYCDSHAQRKAVTQLYAAMCRSLHAQGLQAAHQDKAGTYMNQQNWTREQITASSVVALLEFQFHCNASSDQLDPAATWCKLGGDWKCSESYTLTKDSCGDKKTYIYSGLACVADSFHSFVSPGWIVFPGYCRW